LNKIHKNHELSSHFPNMIFELNPVGYYYTGKATIVAKNIDRANVLLRRYHKLYKNNDERDTFGLPDKVNEKDFTMYMTDEKTNIRNGIYSTV